MLWSTIVTTFGLVFLAELGDKTQLATMLLAAQDKPVWGVFLGAASALILSSLVGTFAGVALSRFLPPHSLQTGAGIAFIFIGSLLLLGKI